ncbi:hypothetical protein [Noviherbaspirillum sp. Root189]|uniref:hypothetical protein n=1 Tax=Noviherbaspirillum sp. Root189 TaxID=1736487 RepID=UPI00070AE82C|nr:hypothetical protein [Noviherbaspirillum sp. Root189]KRB70566.1 hypothetical protein ASE07_08155 [Noviherbaspirillum sp. Root189]
MSWFSVTRHVSRNFLQCIFFLCACLSSTAAMAQGISAAEHLLFETNHMQGIRVPSTLTYSYRKEAAAEDGFEDQVQIDISRINPDNTVATTTRFLSGDRQVPIPAIEEAHGNPAVLGFLERDIVEMKRLTGGASSYFRKRIRLALADARDLRPVRFRYAGREVQGQEVSIQPYLNDPMRQRFPEYEHKSYVFVFSPELPGGLYQISSSSADPAKKEKSGIVETLTLIREQPSGKK